MPNTDPLVIEYPSAGATYGPDENHPPKYGVYRYGTYPSWSVLAGQEKRSFVQEFDRLEEAQAAYPGAEWNGGGSGYRPVTLPDTPPDWFDEANAGEHWSEADAY